MTAVRVGRAIAFSFGNPAAFVDLVARTAPGVDWRALTSKEAHIVRCVLEGRGIPK